MEDHGQRDGDIETMAIRPLQEDRFQQLGISGLQTAQGATLRGETLTPLVLNLETTPNSTLPIPEWELPMRWDGGDRRGVLQQKPHGFRVSHQFFPNSALGQIQTHTWPSPHLKSIRYSRIETVSGLYFHPVCQLRALQRKGPLYIG